MKLAAAICLAIFCSALTAAAQDHYGSTDVAYFRAGRDREFRDPKSTPLLAEDLGKFQGLNYFDLSEKFIVRAKFERTPDEKYFLMPTSSGIPARYVKVGILRFRIDERDLTLAAYQNEKVVTDDKWREKYGGSYFIPYRDLTNGTETYGGGRYIYMKIPTGEEAVLDFNLSFNPSCAYGKDSYSCPLPPRENFLQIKIFAGEKKFDHTAKKQ